MNPNHTIQDPEAKRKELEALRVLKADAPLRCVRRALRQLHDMEVTAMARALGVSRQLISHVITGCRHNRQVEEGIARMWGLPREELWPDENP
ncbi:MAG: hypothetical protein JRJ09_18820 [Deltaproteobacteria bacterium]|nr:hypothetical protein [Deltaproteobacteria bacterium]